MTSVSDPEPEVPAPLGDPVAEVPPVPPPPRRRSGFFSALLGGMLAAAGGFALAHYDLFDLRPPPAPDLSADLAALRDQVAQLSADTAGAVGAELAALNARIAALEALPPPAAVDPAALQALSDRMDAIEALPMGEGASTVALAARLAKLEAALASRPSTDTAALQADLDAALQRLSDAEATATARANEAEAAAATAARDQALRTLTAAVAEGRPFEAELTALADPDLTAALGPMAAAGAPTLAHLQSTFPDAARATLRLSRDISGNEGWTDRLVDFLALQTEARSLTPREGDDPDAVLSRAEFALSEGRVADALAELAALDAALAAPLESWTQDARRYQAAMDALVAAGGD